jgi:hypothetical protein
MLIPILGGTITDLCYLQNAVTLILLDDPRLANTPVIPQFLLQMESDQQVDILWQLPRSAFTVTPNHISIAPGNSGGNNAVNPNPQGLVGAGILVEMPEMEVNSTNVTGPPGTWSVNVVCFEERNVNLTNGVGTGITAEQYAQIVLDNLQLQWIYQFGTLKTKSNSIAPAHDWMSLRPGIMAWRTQLLAVTGRIQSTRSATVTATVSGGSCTLTCSDGGASMYYTFDQSVPCAANIQQNAPAGVGATLYTAPFAVTSGQTVLFASRNISTNTILSPVGGIQI